VAPIERDLHASVAALAALSPGPHWVVSWYLIKMKNRVREAVTALARRPLGRADREAIAADLGRVLEYFADPGRLPSTRGIAIFASQGFQLFEALALPHVHRSRLGVERVPLVRELVALEEEFGTILVAVCDRTAARFFEVTAFDCVELTSLAGIDASRGGRFHASASESAGEHHYHMRIRTEKQRLYAHVADRIFQIHRQRPLTGLVVAGVGVDAGAVVPHLHTYLHDLVLGVVKLNPKQATAAEVREATLALREERERAWERAHADAAKDGVGTGWAVNGIDATLKTLTRGQVRTLLADGQDDDPRIDDAVEEALRQRAQVDVLYDDKARRAVDGLAALLRFRA
jgi:peptide chain release factor subunit 1